MRGLATVTVVVTDYDTAIEHYCGDLGFELVAGEPLGDGEPRSEPYGTVAVFEDAFGNRWDLIQPV